MNSRTKGQGGVSQQQELGEGNIQPEAITQVFENFRFLLDHQRKVVQFGISISLALFAAIGWCYNTDDQRRQWVEWITLVGLLMSFCVSLAAVRSTTLYRSTLQFASSCRDEPVKRLLERYTSEPYGWGPIVSSGAILMIWFSVFLYFVETRLLLVLGLASFSLSWIATIAVLSMHFRKGSVK